MTSRPADISQEIHVRWLIRRDMPEVLAIEDAGFGKPWTEDDFMTALRQRNYIGMVAERGTTVVGFMIYTFHKTHLTLVNLSVQPAMRRCGVGTRMLARLKDKLSTLRRTRMDVISSDRNLQAHLFFRSMGFVATEVLQEHYDDGIDGYLFQYYASE